jgi:hypothetical protein
VLLPDPADLTVFADRLAELLESGDQHLGQMGENGHGRVVERFLPDTQLARWATLIAAVLDGAHDRNGGR